MSWGESEHGQIDCYYTFVVFREPMMYNFLPRNALDTMARDDTAALTGVENSDNDPHAGFPTRCQRNENE